MIEIGKNFLWALTDAKQQSRQEKKTNSLLLSQIQQQAEQLRQAYEDKMRYLLRSSAEKQQLTYENARQQLAMLNAKRAANGINANSASGIDEIQTGVLNQTRTAKTEAINLQESAAQEENSFVQAWKGFVQLMGEYRKKMKRHARLGEWGQAFVSLFK